MTDPKAEFERLLAELRPRLHRYCARMTGSVIDGEDVLQETLVKAIEAFPHTGPLANVEGWLFRIAHNAALDAFRAFQSGIRARCIEPPQPSEATIVGNYRMLGER